MEPCWEDVSETNKSPCYAESKHSRLAFATVVLFCSKSGKNCATCMETKILKPNSVKKEENAGNWSQKKTNETA